MISRYAIILLVVSSTIPAFAVEPVMKDCSGEFTVYQNMICQLDNIRNFFISSMDKQDTIIAQNSQIEKLLIQQNKLQAHTFCAENPNFNMPAKYLGSFDGCLNYILDETK